MEKEIMEALESAKNDLSKISELVNGLSEKMQENNKTNLDKIDEIKYKTGDDLIVVADNIIRNVLNVSKGEVKSQNELTVKLLGEIGGYLSNLPQINLLKSEDKNDEAVELINKTRERNITIYDILFETKTDISKLTALKARKTLNEIEKEVVNQLAILCIEALGMIFESMIAMQNKEEKRNNGHQQCTQTKTRKKCQQ